MSAQGLGRVKTFARAARVENLEVIVVTRDQTHCAHAVRSLARELYFLHFADVRVFTHEVIPGSSHSSALGISAPGIDKVHVMGPCNHGGLQNGAVCRAGCLAEADSDLHRRSDRKDRARRAVASDPETHTGLPTAEQCAGHAEGWAHYLGRLAEVAAGRGPPARPHR